MNASSMRLLISAVEPSGDIIGAALIKELKERRPDTAFYGCGGPLMAAEGFKSLFPIEPFSVFGPVSALRAWPTAEKGARDLAETAKAENVNAAILIDSWAFSRMTAQKIIKRAPRTTLIKYVAPQVWASRPGRAQKLAEIFDGVLTLFEFENQYFEEHDVPTINVGGTLYDQAYAARSDGGAFRKSHALGDAPLLAVLLGSRAGELKRLTTPFKKAVEVLAQDRPHMRLVFAVPPGFVQRVKEITADWPGTPIYVESENRFDAFSAADAALAASGSVTTELAILNTPMVVAYRVDSVSAFIIRRAMTTDYVTMINVAAGREVIPEFLQEKCQPDALAAALAPLLDGGPAKAAQLNAFPDAIRGLGVGGPPPAALAAEAVLSWIDAK